MKIRNIYIVSALLSAGFMLTACSDSYLDVKPSTEIPNTSLIDESVAATAMQGIYESMNTIWDGIDLNQNTGEAYTGTVFNDALGIDFISGIWNSPTMPGLSGWTRLNQSTEFTAAYPWRYYYSIIGQSNRLIEVMTFTSEDNQGVSKKLLSLKAQALTMRSHGYVKLMSLYGQRWEDSDEGEAYCFPLKVSSHQESSPLVKMNDVFNQIYADLNEAIALYEASGVARSNKWEVNADVAHGLLARAALLKHDWRTAADHAKLAYANYKVMEEKELFAGFVSDNDDLMWCCNPDPSIGTWSWGRHYACNGGYVNYWGYGAGAINIDLYNKMDVNDLRRKFFWTPDKLAGLKPASIKNPSGLKEDAFWNPTFVASNNFLNMSNGPLSKKNDKNTGMLDAMSNWLIDYYNDVFTGDRSLIAPADAFYNYYFLTETPKDSKKSVSVKTDAGRMYATVVNVPFGAQCKFWGESTNQVSMYPWMRASEMALVEAEALAELGDATAASVFEAFQQKRVPGYTCTTSGSALIEEIRISRRVELWGEGQNFTDIKRWNMKHICREWKKNDKTSGNWAPGLGLTEANMATTYSNGWRLAIPSSEWQYNPDIDLSLLKKISGE